MAGSLSPQPPPPPPAVTVAPGTTCCVCVAPLASAVRGTAGYRTHLACLRAGVCADHLAGDHVISGVLRRFCSNHHSWHAVSEFGGSDKATTCTHARALAAGRAKEQRALKRSRAEVNTAPARDSSDDELLLLDDADADADASTVAQKAGAAAGQDACSTPPTPLLVSLLPPTVVPRVCTTAADTSAFLDLLAQSTGLQILRCIAGAAAKARCVQRNSSSSFMFCLLCGVAPQLMQHNLKNLRSLEPVLAALVAQAQADETAGSSCATAAPPLGVLLDRLVASANKREAVLTRVKGSWASIEPEVVILVQEVMDGNAAHRHNMAMLTALLQGAALGASAEDHVRIVALVAQWLHQQLGELILAVGKRIDWMTTAPAAPTGLRGHLLTGVVDLTALCARMRTAWLTLTL